MNNLIINQSNSSVDTECPLFTFPSVISSHLKDMNYPESSLKSFLKCGESCGQDVLRRCKACGDMHLINMTYHCSLRTCPECSQLRKKRLIRRFFPYFKDFSTARGSAESLYFLTLSPRNYDNLAEGLDHIKKSWSKFIRTKYIKERVRGGLWVIETKNTGKGWHIHIHALFYGRRLDNSIRGFCNDCRQNHMRFDKNTKRFYCSNRHCGSSNVVVNQNSKLVQLFTASSSRECNVNVQELRHGSYGALEYVLKYISVNKSDIIDSLDYAKYIFFTRKQKLINLFGTFTKFKLVKKVPLCLRCGGEIEYILDRQLIDLCRDSMDSPPPTASQTKEHPSDVDGATRNLFCLR